MKKLFSLVKKVTNNKKGFTLTEIMVTVSIVSTVSSLGMSQYNDALASARDAQRLANIKQVQTALNLFYLDHEAYPACVATTAPTEGCYTSLKNTLEQGTYMSEVPVDPLNQGLYVFKYYSDGKNARIEYETEDTKDASPKSTRGSFSS